MASDYDSILSQLDTDDYWLPKGILRKKALSHKKETMEPTSSPTSPVSKASQALLDSDGDLETFVKAYSRIYLSETKKTLSPVGDADDLMSFVKKEALSGYSKQNASLLSETVEDLEKVWSKTLDKVTKSSTKEFQSVFDSIQDDTKPDVIEAVAATAVSMVLDADLLAHRLIRVFRSALADALPMLQMEISDKSGEREALLKDTANLSNRRLETLRKAALKDVYKGKAPSKVLSTDEAKEGKRVSKLLKKYGFNAEEYDERKDEIDAREELAELQRSRLSKAIGGKVSGIKERLTGDDSLLAKATFRKFRGARKDKAARVLELQARINESRNAATGSTPTSSDVDYVTKGLGKAPEIAANKEAKEAAAQRETQRILTKIADSTKSLAKNADGMGSATSAAAAALAGGALPATIASLGTAATALLSIAGPAALATAIAFGVSKVFGKEGMSSMPSETGEYKLSKPIGEMSTWERFTSRAGSRRQDIEEMVENGKKFTVTQAADIKKYYGIDVPAAASEEEANAKTLSYAKPTPTLPETGSSESGAAPSAPAASAPSTSKPDPKSLIKAVSGAAGAGYESVKSAASKFVSPVAGRISSFFNPARKHPVTGKTRPHKGVDFAVKEGTPVAAAGAGTVSLVNESHKDFGKVVMVAHPDGTSSLYAHNSQIMVKQGDKVEPGQQIALSGNTGLSSGPHLHFETMKGNAMGSGQFDPGSVIPSLASSGGTGEAGAAPTALASAAGSTVEPTPSGTSGGATPSPPASMPTAKSPTAMAAAIGSTPKPATGGTNVATVPTYAYMDSKFFALNLSALT